MIATEDQRIKALSLFPVNKVWGIGRRITKSLEYYGITNAHEFAWRPRSWIQTKYHITGVRTWMELNGENAIELDDLNSTTKRAS